MSDERWAGTLRLGKLIYLGPLPAINLSYSATSFALPMTRGVRSWMDSGCKSRIRCVPVLPRRNTQQKRKTLPQGGVFFSLSVVSFFYLNLPKLFFC